MNYKQRKFIFKEQYIDAEGVIPKGSEIILFRGIIYFNGGMVHPGYQKMLKDIVDTPHLNKKYLKEVQIIHNKI